MRRIDRLDVQVPLRGAVPALGATRSIPAFGLHEANAIALVLEATEPPPAVALALLLRRGKRSGRKRRLERGLEVDIVPVRAGPPGLVAAVVGGPEVAPAIHVCAYEPPAGPAINSVLLEVFRDTCEEHVLVPAHELDATRREGDLLIRGRENERAGCALPEVGASGLESVPSIDLATERERCRWRRGPEGAHVKREAVENGVLRRGRNDLPDGSRVRAAERTNPSRAVPRPCGIHDGGRLCRACKSQRS